MNLLVKVFGLNKNKNNKGIGIVLLLLLLGVERIFG